MLKTVAFILFSSIATATSWGPASIVELYRDSDVVIEGKATIGPEKMVIHVTRTLRGEALDSLALSSTEAKLSFEIIQDGAQGIFFLRKDRDKSTFRPFHPNCFQAMQAIPRVVKVIERIKDPTLLKEALNESEDLETITLLGQLFTAYHISSEEVPNIKTLAVERFVFFPDNSLPWSVKSSVTIAFAFDPNANPTIRVVSVDPPAELSGKLVSYLKDRLIYFSSIPYNASTLKSSFSVHLDTRVPPTVGTVTSRQAVEYLRKQLKSKDHNILIASLQALALMRDQESATSVEKLVRLDSSVVAAAIDFLQAARVSSSAPTLCRIMNQSLNQEQIPATGSIAARALAMLEKPDLDCLEKTAAQGLENAAEGLALAGRPSSFPYVLRGAERVSENQMFLDSLYWLVLRSNKKRESWMPTRGWTPEIGKARTAQWRTWWNQNHKNFKLIRTREEAAR